MRRPQYLEEQVTVLFEELDQARAKIIEQQRTLNYLVSWVGQVFNAPVLRHGAQATALESAISGLRERVDLLSQDRTQRRKDLVSKDYLVHQEIARELEVLVNQDLVRAAMTQIEHADAEEEVANVVGALSHALFARETWHFTRVEIADWLADSSIDLPPEELNQLYATVSGLKQAAENTRHDHEWCLDGQDASFDRGRQQLWPGSAGEKDAVRIVVAPGYFVEDKVYFREYVYTVSATPRHRLAGCTTVPSGPGESEGPAPEPDASADVNADQAALPVITESRQQMSELVSPDESPEPAERTHDAEGGQPEPAADVDSTAQVESVLNQQDALVAPEAGAGSPSALQAANDLAGKETEADDNRQVDQDPA